MIRLDEIQENKIINEGKAGVVKNVTMKIVRKTPEDISSFPDFKIVFSEDNGANIDIGIYYFHNKDYETESEINKRRNRYLYRLMHVVKAVMGVDFSSNEEFATMKEATDFCIKTIEENSLDKLFNIFITFGTIKYPSKKGFLEVRFLTPFVKSVKDTLTFPLKANAEDIIDKDELIFLKKKNELNDTSDIFTRQS